MNLDAVMDEVAQVIGGIVGLRVTAYPPGSITPPAGYVSYPQQITFDATYRRGVDRYVDLPITLLAGRVIERSARNTVAGWTAGGGESSVKALAEAHSWTSCDDLTITECTFDVEEIGAVKYLAAVFLATVVGPGSTEE